MNMLPARSQVVVRRYAATVTFRDQAGGERREEFPVVTGDHQSATRLATAYVLDVLGLQEFELRVVGS
jgi:hypothetical protein